MRSIEEIKEAISTGKACLGIEFGSTRIKAVLIDVDKAPIASGTYDWENRYVDHIWTYSEEDIWNVHQDDLRLRPRGQQRFDAAVHVGGGVIAGHSKSDQFHEDTPSGRAARHAA